MPDGPKAPKTAKPDETGGTPAPGTTARTPAAPRSYVVFREFTLAELLAMHAPDAEDDGKSYERTYINDDAIVMVRISAEDGATPKAARIAAAKAHIDAVADSALRGGKAPVRLVVEETLI